MIQSEPREGGCLCGAVRYRIDGTPGRATHCHCLHCRRASGSAFVTWMVVGRSGFRILSGTPNRYDSRPGATRGFCGRCGTQLTFENTDEPETIDVTVASLDDPEGISPEDHVWSSRMAPWVELSDRLPRFQRGRSDD